MVRADGVPPVLSKGGSEQTVGVLPPEADQPTVPGWCSALMEGGVEVAIALAVFLAASPAVGTVRWLVVASLLLSAVMWGLHSYYLRRPAVLLSWPLGLFVLPLLVIYSLALLFGLRGMSLAEHADWLLELTLCVLLFVVVTGAFSERQAGRLCAFLCVVGVVEALVAFWLVGPARGSEGSPLGSAPMVGTLGSEWALGAFLCLSLVGALTFAGHILTAAAPPWADVYFRSRTSWWGSRGVSMAAMSSAGAVVILLALLCVDSLAVAPLCGIAGAVFFAALGFKGRLRGLFAVLGVLAGLGFGVMGLSRPRGPVWVLSGRALSVNLRSLAAGEDARVSEEALLGGESSRVPPDQSRPIGLAWGDLARIGGATVWLLPVLVVGLVVSLLITAVRGLVRFNEGQPVLAAGGLAGVVGFTLFVLFGACLEQMGVALAGSALCALAAAGGDFEVEVEEP